MLSGGGGICWHVARVGCSESINHMIYNVCRKSLINNNGGDGIYIIYIYSIYYYYFFYAMLFSL